MNDRFRWEVLVGAVALTALGLVGGWFAAGPRSAAQPADDQPAADAGQFEAATLANLGVSVAAIEPTEFSRYVTVAAVVSGTPRTEQPVFAPIGGRVRSVDVELGQTVEPGATVVVLVRDALPRPSLVLTAEILKPAQENIHETVTDLRRAAEEVRIARAELDRVAQFKGKVGDRELPIVPRQRVIDLQYQRSRAERELDQARHELEKHGLTSDQVAEIQQGKYLPILGVRNWKLALERNGLWTAAAERVHAALPESVSSLPWVTATIGELSASGLASAELAAWLSAEPDAGEHFLDIGVLLQRGHTITDLQRLHRLGAFESLVRVGAPPTSGAWDVHSILVKPGSRVMAGTELATLRNPAILYLRTEPVGGEVGAVLEAARSDSTLSAKPLIPGAGPELSGLRLAFVQSDLSNDGTVAFVTVPNSIIVEHRFEARPPSRTWGLREGLRYVLRVPVEQMDDVYVLPASAVTDDGPDKVVFLEDGRSFRPVPIAIAYQDQDVVVVPVSKDVKLFPGDRVVQTGAFELGLALVGSGGLDGGHGHSHN